MTASLPPGQVDDRVVIPGVEVEAALDDRHLPGVPSGAQVRLEQGAGLGPLAGKLERTGLAGNGHRAVGLQAKSLVEAADNCGVGSRGRRDAYFVMYDAAFSMKPWARETRPSISSALMFLLSRRSSFSQLAWAWGKLPAWKACFACRQRVSSWNLPMPLRYSAPT